MNSQNKSQFFPRHGKGKSVEPQLQSIEDLMDDVDGETKINRKSVEDEDIVDDEIDAQIKTSLLLFKNAGGTANFWREAFFQYTQTEKLFEEVFKKQMESQNPETEYDEGGWPLLRPNNYPTFRRKR